MNEPGHVGPPGFDVLVVDTIIADERVSHGDDLALVGGVREDFLVTGHGSIEAHFAQAEARAPKPSPANTDHLPKPKLPSS